MPRLCLCGPLTAAAPLPRCTPHTTAAFPAGPIALQAEADEKAKAEGKEGADPVAPVMKTEWKEEESFKVQNDNKPLWVRSPKEVSRDEYDAFFKTTFR